MSRMVGSGDVGVVGGGPAGLATAAVLARRGMTVTVFEAKRPPVDKACGEGLMPDAVGALRGLGVDAAQLGRPFAGVFFVDGSVEAEGSFPPGRGGVGVRRTSLHRALARVAAESGAEVRFGERVEAVGDEGTIRLRGRPGAERFDLVVGADGLRSRVRRWAGIDVRSRRTRRFGVRRHLAVRPWRTRVEVTWSEAAEAYVTPVAEDVVGVAILWSGRAGGFDELLVRFPALAERIRGAEALSRDRGAGPFGDRPRRLVAGRVVLVGDAAGSVDGITGEGIGLALREAEALAASLEEGRLGGYRRRVQQIRRPVLVVERLLLAVEARPRLRRRAIAAMARRPRVFDRFLGVLGANEPLVGLVPAMATLVPSVAATLLPWPRRARTNRPSGD